MQIITQNAFQAEGVAGAKTEVRGWMACLRKSKQGTFLEVQWLRIHLAMQGTWV